MDDEFRGKISRSGHRGGAYDEWSPRLQLPLETGPADTLELTECSASGLQRVRGRSNYRVRFDGREVVDHHINHLEARSRERRYICWASSGRFKRS